MGDKSFNGKTALVPGASRGIGTAVALGLASAGADLALLARSQPALDEVAEHGRALGARVVVLPTDLTDQSALAIAVQHAQKVWSDRHSHQQRRSSAVAGTNR